MPTPEVPPISTITLRFFTRIVRRYFRRHFRSVMAQNIEHLANINGPAIIYANHSSWWDPMLSILLAQTILPHRKHYAPMDAIPLARYPILRKLGIFPIEISTPRGAAHLLRTATAILNSGGILWITPQGRFADPREPLTFKPGLAALALRNPTATILPLAIEYTFWDERLPEALLRFGHPAITLESTIEQTTTHLEANLKTTMLDLEKASISRDPAAFHPILQGARGTGGFYAFAQQIHAFFTKKNHQSDHTRRNSP
jgi:1-acyl-sn-glycerol-3-phosphate acyltransferase